MKIRKSWLARLDLISVSKNGYIHEDPDPSKSYIAIEHVWLGRVTDQKVIKISGLEEVEVDQAGLLKQLLGFGTLIFKGQGVTEQLLFVKNPNSYRQYLTDAKNSIR